MDFFILIILFLIYITNFKTPTTGQSDKIILLLKEIKELLKSKEIK